MSVRYCSYAVAGLAALFVTCMPAMAAIIYVDADTSNTTIDGNAIVVNNTTPPGNVTSSRVASDGFWAFETNATFGTNSNSVFAAGGAGEDAGTLETTVSGLASNTYRVWAFYWAGDKQTPDPGNPPSNNNNRWDVAASLNGGTTVTAAGITGSQAGIDASTLNYVADPSFTGGNRDLAATFLGTFTGTSFSVAVNDPVVSHETGFTDGRSWYDGVGYEIVPEPATGLMLALFGCGMLMGWRKF